RVSGLCRSGIPAFRGIQTDPVMDAPARIMNSGSRMSQLQIGMLGCGSPARYAIVDPARQLPDVVAYGVASRSAEKARRFAAEYSIFRHYETYDDLLTD